MENNKSRTSGRPKKRPDLADFYALYDDKTISIEELCRIWKVKKQTIYQWSSYYNKKFKGGGKRLIS